MAIPHQITNISNGNLEPTYLQKDITNYTLD